MKQHEIKVVLMPMKESDREQFIKDNQEAFRYGAMEEFGLRDNHFEEPGEIISRKTIERCMDQENSEVYRIVCDGLSVGGVILLIDNERHQNALDLFFVSPQEHGRGIGYAAWQEIEKLHPETEVWETCTPYFETRNIHFYINKCGFHAVEFFNKYHRDDILNELYCEDAKTECTDDDMMFRFEKVMKLNKNGK